MGAPKRTATQKIRFLKGTDSEVFRAMQAGGKRRFVWCVKTESGGSRVVPIKDTELR
jgi:hypothetical protein